MARVLAAAGVVLTVALTAAMALQASRCATRSSSACRSRLRPSPRASPPTVTIALALGARAMADRGAIVRRLAAVETLGATTLVARTGPGRSREHLRVAACRPVRPESEADVLAAAVLASAAELLERDGLVEVAGDPVDAAIVLAAHETGVLESALTGRTLVDEIPFDPGAGG